MSNNVINYMNYLFSGLIGAIIGALIGGFVSAWRSYLFTKKHTKELEDRKIQNFTVAIYTELTALKERYMKIAGNLIEEIDIEREIPLIGILPTSQNYFVVFDNLPSDIFGLLDSETAKNVINAYINIVALIDKIIYLGININSFYKLLDHVGFHYNEYNQFIDYKKLTNDYVINIDKLTKLLDEKKKKVDPSSYFASESTHCYDNIIKINKSLKEMHDNTMILLDKTIDNLQENYLKISNNFKKI